MPHNIELIRTAIKSLFPAGSIWTVAQDQDLDKLITGMSQNWEVARSFLYNLGFVRDPFRTLILEELEREFGILPDFDLTEELRRQQLSAVKFDDTDAVGSAEDLQLFLNNAGFDVQVHQNSPAVDPALFPGDLLVTTPIQTFGKQYLMQCGGGIAFCGHQDAVCGRFNSSVSDARAFELPTDPTRWPFIFFVGGDATRDMNGALTAIDTADVPLNRRGRFEEFILKTKPWFTWAVLLINYT